jgi:hypothetical protein
MKGEVYGKRELTPLVGQQKKDQLVERKTEEKEETENQEK